MHCYQVYRTRAVALSRSRTYLNRIYCFCSYSAQYNFAQLIDYVRQQLIHICDPGTLHSHHFGLIVIAITFEGAKHRARAA